MDSHNQISTIGYVRSPQACDQCRRLKVKCIRPREGEPCNKCVKSQLSCLTSHVRRTRPVAQVAKSRVAVLEEKLNSMLDLLSQSEVGHGTSDSESNSSLSHDHLTGSTPEQSLKDVADSPATTDSPSPLGLSDACSQYLLDEYRKRQSYFPFVVVPEKWSFAYMQSERPFLLLAAITCSSSNQPYLQAALAEEFRVTLAERVIVNGERDLDILQGLLVHLAWFQYHCRPRSHQAYQYMQLAISMVTDLSLDDDPFSLTEHRSDVFIRHPLLRDIPSKSIEIADLEAQRAYLGCYFISINLSTFLGKPNKLPFTNHTLNCAKYLQQCKEQALDPFIIHLIHLQRLREELNAAYKTEGNLDNCRRQYLLSQEEHFRLQLEQWKAELPCDIHESDLLLPRYLAISVSIHEAGLIYRFGRQRSMASYKEPETLPDPSISLSSTLQSCIEAANEYLTFIQNIPLLRLQQLPMDVWSQLVFAFVAVYKLSVGALEIPEWNPEIARSICDLEQHLAQISTRLNSLPKSATVGFDTLFHMFPSILESAGVSYGLIREQPLMFPQGIRVHGLDPPHDGEPNTLTTSHSKCPAFRHLSHIMKNGPISKHAKLDEQVAHDIHCLEEQLSR